MSVATGVTGVSGAVITIDTTGGGIGSAGTTGATGAPAKLISAQYFIRAGNGGDYGDGTLLPYFGVHQEPPPDPNGTKPIWMDDRTMVLRDSGNYLVNFSVASNGTKGIPNIHMIVTDANGRKDYDFMNVMPQGMTSGAMLLPISGPGRVQFQIQGSGASVTIPPNPPMGELSIVKISS
jgi:hypothetical protein